MNRVAPAATGSRSRVSILRLRDVALELRRVIAIVLDGMAARTRRPRSSPRSKIAVGATAVNRSDLEGLRRAWKHKELVLCLGAGVSLPYGMPSWNTLVLELLFEQTEGTRRLGSMWPHYRRAVAAWMTEYFDYNPLVLARMVERDLRKRAGRAAVVGDGDPFLERLRKHLYPKPRKPKGRTALQAVADLVEKSSDSAGIASIVTFNFDDLLERELAQREVRVKSVVGPERQRGSGLPVVHAHGFIPRTGRLTRENLVFTEPDYHRLTESVFHWGLSEIVERLRKSTVLFIGLSMSDPSLRRLLDASRNCDIPPHWQIQKRHQVRDHEVGEAMTDVDRRARAYAQTLGSGFNELKDPKQLEDSIHAVLKQADTYDQRVFESMGVKTIWVDEFEHIPAVIDAIAR